MKLFRSSLQPILLIVLGLLIASVAANIFLSIQVIRKNPADNGTQDSEDLPFLSQRIFAEDSNDILINFVSLREKLREYTIDLDDVGVYFEYLPSGVSIGIHDTERYPFVSLIKIPVAMAIYNAVEGGSISLQDELSLEEKHKDPKFGTLWQQKTGATFAIEDLIHISLTESDNTANNMLISVIPISKLADVFDALDIPKDIEKEELVITPKNYASILRSLYLSSYLPKQMSNEILRVLTETIYNDLLPLGVPEEVPIAHKVGIQDNALVYTDCGIVYVPKRPYILCAMSKGKTIDEAKTIIVDISRMVYDYVSTTNNIRKY